jgi:glutaredoxin
LTREEFIAVGMGDSLLAESRTAPVVIFRSRLSDTRRMTGWLKRHDVDHREIEMPMGDAGARERFHELRHVTGWETLPQVFVNGEFVGGEPEFFAHRLVREQRRQHAGETAGRGDLDLLRKSLGYGGLVPFVAGLLVLAFTRDPGVRGQAELMLLGYGAVILSFLGAVHWGRLVAAPGLSMPVPLVVWSCVPPVLGWATLLLPFAAAAPAQALLFAAVYLVDRALLTDRDAPRGYLTMRLRLTMLVVGALIASWVVA